MASKFTELTDRTSRERSVAAQVDSYGGQVSSVGAQPATIATLSLVVAQDGPKEGDCVSLAKTLLHTKC